MQLINQRDTYDCGVACIAMLMDITYEESLEKCGEHYKPGWGMATEMQVFTEIFDLKRAYSDGMPGDIRKYQRGDMIHPKYLRTFLWAIPKALVTVTSLNLVDGLHFVVWRDQQVFDPNKGREGKKFYESLSDLDVVDFIAFRN